MSSPVTQPAPHAPATREAVLALLRDHADEMREQFGVCSTKLFGSFARDEATPESDVDILVEFEDTPTPRQYFGASAHLEDLFGRRVDMFTRKNLRDFILPNVDRDLNGLDSTDGSSPERQWRPYVLEMVEACEAALQYVEGITRDAFLKDRLRFNATVWQVTRIGSAADWLPTDIREANPQVPWQLLIDTGNELIHKYYDIDEDELWSLVSAELPSLVEELRHIAAES